MTLAFTTGESETEDYAMEAFSPKIAQKDGAMDEMMAFIQEDQFSEKEATCDCQPAVTKAYGKFRGDMKKIEALKEQCDTRANKAETESQKQAGISRRCLAAESMLSADEKTKSKKMREAISKETSVEAAQYSEKSKDLAKQCTEKISLARLLTKLVRARLPASFLVLTFACASVRLSHNSRLTFAARSSMLLRPSLALPVLVFRHAPHSVPRPPL